MERRGDLLKGGRTMTGHRKVKSSGLACDAKRQGQCLLLCLAILTMASGVSGHLPLSLLQNYRHSNAESLSKMNLAPSSSSSSSPGSPFASSSSPSSPHQQRMSLVYWPHREDPRDRPNYDFKISSSVLSPYYLSVGRKGQENRQSIHTSPSNARSRYPTTGRNLKVSQPSCSVLKSLWRSGKLVIADSIPSDESSSQVERSIVYGQVVPSSNVIARESENVENEIVDGAIANLPPGRFGDFVRNGDTRHADYSIDTVPSDHISLDVNSGSTARPIVKLSGSSHSYLNEGQIESVNSVDDDASPDSLSSAAGAASSSPAPASHSSSEFFNAVWHNGPVNI